ncbi:leucine carboxyl methyltransferase [Dendrothele bispora CBS 962.96]|uniref:Leucine carboxyl methyltransferase 1 n=1 Tax=Dendrothele bispora (strain CBS 962.96) TaxID=1314807 RepID=A0A4S8MSR9_DENBC|nr:leucine carboxyl methyltransferase [Dendrothele bispora CBS 962.96]
MFPPPSKPQDADSSIRLTDNDAALARLSAVQKGYLSDPFIRSLVPRAHLQPSRPPLINVGTFVRTVAIDDLVEQWLSISSETGTKCQIVSLGAGSDTRFWRIATGPLKDQLAAYVEIDFPEVTTKKAMAIKKSKDLTAIFGDSNQIKLAQGGVCLHAPNYHLLGADLRKSPSETLGSLISPESGSLLDPSLPTLLLCECVLVYMSLAESSAILQWFGTYFKESVLGCVVYEMFGLDDAFGRVMVNNLKSRNVTLPGAEHSPDASVLPKRFLDLGFTTSRALTLREIRRAYVDPKELERISGLEMLDEVEELELVLQHYAIISSLTVPNREDSRLWTRWVLKQKQSQSNED